MKAGVDRRSAMEVLHARLTDELVIGGLGNQSYDLYLAGDRPANFYMWGAMGIAPSVGLGVALAAPGARIIALEGDGGMLMNLGALTTIGALAPRNLGLILFDNHVYDLTGGQVTATGRGADLCAIARGCGIHRAERVETIEDFTEAIDALIHHDGTWLLVVETAPTPADRKKPLIELRERFMQLEPFVRQAAVVGERS